jgi:hypothetical protein
LLKSEREKVAMLEKMLKDKRYVHAVPKFGLQQNLVQVNIIDACHLPKHFLQAVHSLRRQVNDNSLLYEDWSRMNDSIPVNLSTTPQIIPILHL